MRTLVSPLALLLRPESWHLALCSPSCVASESQVTYRGEEKYPRRALVAVLGWRGFDDTELGIAMAEQGGLEKGKEAKLAAAAAS